METTEVSTDSLQPLSDYADRPAYNTKAVAVRTGVPADTFRAWERRYGVPKPYRTGESHRLYSDRDVAAISWLKKQTDTGLTISQAIALLHAKPEAAPASSLRPASVEEAARHLFNLLVGLDSPQADRLLTNSLNRFGVESTCLLVIEPVMYRIGQEWANGTVPVSVEHFATYFVRTRLMGLINATTHAGSLGPVITACAPGEAHEVGLLMLNLFLLRRGVRVIHLGADLPIDDLVAMAQRTSPRIICLSASTHDNAVALLKSVRSLRDSGGITPRIACGGYAFRAYDELKEEVEPLWLGADAEQAADAIRSLLSKD